MAISFNQVPSAIRVPWAFIEFDNSKAIQGPSLKAYKGLLIGQKLSGGSAAANTPVRVTSKAQGKTLFGAGSMLSGMVDAWLDNNPLTELWCIPVADADAGVAASGELVFTGNASADGTLNLYLAGKKYAIAVTSGNTPENIAAAVEAAVTADSAASFTATQQLDVNDHKVTIAYKHKGLVGNELDIRLNYYEGEALPAGVSCAITGLASGTTNPTLTGAISAMGEVQYDVIGFPYTDATSLTAIETELASRWGPLRQNDGRAFAASNKNLSDLGTLGSSRNSPHLIIIEAYKEPTPIYAKAAALAAVAGYYLNIDPARPLQTLPLTGILPAKQEDRFILSERNILLFDGIATSYVDAGGIVRIERAITTYKTNAVGAEDPSYLDVETLATLSYLRYDFRNTILRKYPRHKLAGDNIRVAPGQAIMTPKLGKAEAVAIFSGWEDLGLVEGIEQFKADLIVERNASDANRLDWYLSPDLVNQLRINGVQIGFLL